MRMRSAGQSVDRSLESKRDCSDCEDLGIV